MEEQIREILNKEFPELLRKNLMSFQNATVPQHTHNMVDSPAVKAPSIDTSGGFTFGTKGNNVQLGYQPINNTFVIRENETPSTVNFQIYSFKNIDIFANGLDSGDHTLLSFTNSPQSSTVLLDATKGQMIYTAGLGDVSSITLNSGQVLTQTDDSIDTSSSELTPNLLEYTASGDFAIQLPDTTAPSPVAGMIRFTAGVFYVCEITGTWRTIVTAP